MDTNNPLLTAAELPPFSKIKLEHIEPAIETIIADNRAALLALRADPLVAAEPGWDNLIARLENLDERLGNT